MKKLYCLFLILLLFSCKKVNDNESDLFIDVYINNGSALIDGTIEIENDKFDISYTLPPNTTKLETIFFNNVQDHLIRTYKFKKNDKVFIAEDSFAINKSETKYGKVSYIFKVYRGSKIFERKVNLFIVSKELRRDITENQDKFLEIEYTLESGELEYDGVYCNQIDHYYSYFKFYQDGSVIETTVSNGLPNKIKEWFVIDNENVFKGEYDINENTISISTKKDNLENNYKGNIYKNYIEIVSDTRHANRFVFIKNE